MSFPAASTVSTETLPRAGLVSFSAAAEALRKVRPVKYREAAGKLISFTQILRAAQILRELKPGEIDKFQPEDGWLRSEDSFYSLGGAVLEAVCAIAPLDEEAVDCDLQDGCFRMIPAQMGYAMDWDTWSETVENPDENLSEQDGVWAFCAALGQGDQGAFESFSEYFG
jgi:hypothetical protein